MLFFVDIYYDPGEPDQPLRYRRTEWDGDEPVPGSEDSGPIRNLDDLAAALDGAEMSQHSGYRVDELPTFGGDEPGDNPEIVSWDEDRLLIWDGAGGFTIHARG